MPISQSLLERIETFRRNLDSYLNPEYKEAHVRHEFIDPLFSALGWDMKNESGYAEAYKDVVHEDSLRISGVGTTAPDYSFRIGGTRKFFVEAKKPSVSLKDNPEPALQLRRYSWSAKLPLGIVTDFQEFAIYDTRIRPKQGDKASSARIFYGTYEDYPKKWNEIADIFSREAVLKGSFDKYAAANKGKRGTAEFDDDFLADLEVWRKHLAENLALRNGSLSQRDLNFAVQRILDRIIFLRIAEERGIENYGQLMALIAGPKIYPRLCEIFEKADYRYNSGLFHFEKEPGRDESPDRLTLGLALDDAVLKEIISSLYYPKSPYAFSVIPAETLGNVYEQFLGKVIHLTDGHRAKIEEKPEVRKAGGVYYTPNYIVNHIVTHAVGPLLTGRTPKQVEKLRILDPACGSGSFLLGAYEFLLDWHLRYYLEHEPEAWAKKKFPPIYETAPNANGAGQGSKNWQLTSAERKRILQNNLYGVDIDVQAVEVTKLSLLLKVLEGEARELRGKQLDFHRVLPDLGSNIKCGNSLIGSDFYSQLGLPSIDEEMRYKVNPFDWTFEFKPIMDAGGFDAVIGNPPWLMAGYYLEEELEYIRQKYSTATGKFDLYYCFFEQSLKLLSKEGLCGLITPNKFFHTKAARALRDFLVTNCLIAGIIDFGDAQLFRGATNYSAITLLSKRPTKVFRFKKVKADFTLLEEAEVSLEGLMHAPEWNLGRTDLVELFRKITLQSVPLSGLVSRFGTGLQTGADKIYTLKPDDIADFDVSCLRPILRGRDVRRYCRPRASKLLHFPYRDTGVDFEIFSDADLTRAKVLSRHLLRNKAKLDQRIWFDQTAEELSGAWFGFVYMDSKRAFTAPHILTPALSSRANFTLGRGELFVTGTAGVTSIIPAENIPESIFYLLGMLNSKLLSLYVVRHSPVFSGGFYKFSAPYLKRIPIRRIDFSKPSEKRTHELLSDHVKRVLKLGEEALVAKSPDVLERLQREAAAADRSIDQLVYELYGLGSSEIQLVEEASALAAHPAGSETVALDETERE